MAYLEVSRKEADFVLTPVEDLKEIEEGLDAVIVQLDLMYVLSSNGYKKVLKKDSFYEFNLDVLKNWMINDQGNFSYESLFEYSEKNNVRVYSVEDKVIEQYVEGENLKSPKASRFDLIKQVRSRVPTIPWEGSNLLNQMKDGAKKIPKPNINLVPESAKEPFERMVSSIRERIPKRLNPIREDKTHSSPYELSNALDAEKIMSIVVPRIVRLMHAQNVTHKPRIGIFYSKERLGIADYLRQDEKRRSALQSHSLSLESALEYYFDGDEWFVLPVTVNP